VVDYNLANIPNLHQGYPWYRCPSCGTKKKTLQLFTKGLPHKAIQPKPSSSSGNTNPNRSRCRRIMQDNRPHQPPADFPCQIAIDTLHVALLLFNHKAEIIYANPPAQHLFNRSPDTTSFPLSCGEFIGCVNHLQDKQPCGHTAFCDQCTLLHGLRTTLAGTSTSETFTGEHLPPGENGPPRWIKYTCTPLVVNQRRGALLAIEDITRQHRTEQNYQILFQQMINALALHEKRLQENKDHLNLVLEGANLAFWDWHIPSGALTFNDIWPTMLGYSRAEIEPHINTWKQLVHPDDFSPVMQTLDAHLEGLTSHYQTEHRLRHKSGHWIWVLDKGRVIARDIAGNPVRVCGTHHDISERKHNEEERKRLQAQLVQAQKMEAIGALAGGIAHDFNNILSAILGYTEMAHNDLLPQSPAAQNLNKVMEASLRASTLAKQILTFSRQSESEKSPLEPALIVKEAIRLLRSTLPATIVIRQQIAPRTALVCADATQMHQVLLNLCTNSFHAMEQTGGVLDISLDNCTTSPPGAPAGAFVRLSVSDTGPGIPLELQDKIFQPYFTTKEAGKGTGLGLSIVHGIVTNHGGFITCTSSPGNGTTFHLYFPAWIGTCFPSSQPETTPATGREHILLVDDEQILVETGTALLQRLGYKVTGRTDSLEALDIFRMQPHRFDAVITDQTMPEMTGLDLARRLLQIRPDLPIILCTGYSALVSEEEVLAQGIKAFVLKPLTKKDVAATLRRVLDEQPQ
jgi:PAS domain S-box-containing protein